MKVVIGNLNRFFIVKEVSDGDELNVNWSAQRCHIN